MVSSGQIFNIALIIVGGYVVITYGPQIITAIKKSMDDMKAAADTGGGGTPAPAPAGGDTTIPPFPDPGMTDQIGQTAIPDPQYAPPAQYTDPGQLAGVQKLLDIPPSTANVPIDPSGLVQQYPTVSSPQNPVHKKKSKSSSPTITKQQKQQEHIQNSTTSTGAPVAPPHVPVSQAHPAPAKVSAPTVRAPRPVPPSAPGHGTLQSRYGPGTSAREDIDFQVGCNCVGKSCCYRGHRCDQSLGAECGPNTPGQCTTLRARFLAKNPCNKPAKPKPVIGQLRSRFPPKPTTEMALNPTASFARAYKGYGIGDTGDIVSLDSLSVTIA